MLTELQASRRVLARAESAPRQCNPARGTRKGDLYALQTQWHLL